MQPIANLGRQTQSLKLQQCERIAPRLEFALSPITHLGFNPMHFVGQTEFVKSLEKRKIRNAMEVVIPLNGQTVEVKRRRHSADPVVGFKNHGRVTFLNQLIGSGYTHWARAKNSDIFFLSRSVHIQISDTTGE